MIGWLDCSAGTSGDMLLGAVVDAGAALATLQEAVDAVGVEPVRLRAEPVLRGGLGATYVQVVAPRSMVTRTWPNIRDLLERAPIDDAIRARALDVFARLAAAEGRVHRVAAEQVHFHEVGALDAIADVVGVAAGLHALGVLRLSAGRVAVGNGMTRSEHGLLPVPTPAVLELLSEVDAPLWSGPVAQEMCTPTGAALLAASVSTWETMPEMTVHRVGTGAGSREVDELPNVIRLVLGEPLDSGIPRTAVVLETNVDDIDPRLWPGVLGRLIDAGAADAWLTPILMKKGRPAHTLHALCQADQVEALRSVIFTETPTIGVRQVSVGKFALDRETVTVDVDGRPVRAKLALAGGRVVNVSVEHDDVVAAAAALGRPVKAVLAAATSAAQAVASTR